MPRNGPGISIRGDKYEAKPENSSRVFRVSSQVIRQLFFSSELVEVRLLDIVDQQSQQVVKGLTVLSQLMIPDTRRCGNVLYL